MVYALCSLEGEDKTPEIWSHGCDYDNNSTRPCYCLFVAAASAPKYHPGDTDPLYEPHCRPSIALRLLSTLPLILIFEIAVTNYSLVAASRRHAKLNYKLIAKLVLVPHKPASKSNCGVSRICLLALHDAKFI